ARELRKRVNAELARLLRAILDPEPPVFEGLTQRDEVRRVHPDAGVFRADQRVRRSVAASRLILIERLAYRLPARAPEIAALAIAQVKVAARLIQRHRVAAQPKKAMLRRTLVEAVAARVVGDDRAVFGRAEIIAPRTRRIRARDDVFAGLIVE